LIEEIKANQIRTWIFFLLHPRFCKFDDLMAHAFDEFGNAKPAMGHNAVVVGVLSVVKMRHSRAHIDGFVEMVEKFREDLSSGDGAAEGREMGH
jgi:hypothetical protein